MSNKRQGNGGEGTSGYGNDSPTEPKRSRSSNDPQTVDESSSESWSALAAVENMDICHAEVGIIECIQLRNFMCHARLEFKFGSNVNFIVGQNGSGKSALMSAIVVGLGGTAHSTNRGRTLSSFIMSGKQTADVSISLRNCGALAWKPEEYGSRITVERHLSMSGSNYYRLRGDTGRTVSDKRDELLAILDRFNIQVDNPVCILNQDASRNFLNSKNPKNKYKLFLRATQLDQIKQDYDFAHSKGELASKMVDQKASWLPVLEKEVEDWRQKHEFQESLDGLRDQAKDLRVLIAWGEFGNLEKELKADEDKLESIRQQTPVLLEKVEQYKEKISNAHKKRAGIELELQNVLTEIELKEHSLREKKEELNLKKQMQNNAKLEFQKATVSARSIIKDRDSLKQRIEEMKTIDVAKQLAEKEERLQKIAALENSRADTQTKLMTSEHHCEQLKNSNSRYKDDLSSIAAEVSGLRGELDSKRRQMQNLVGSRANRLRRFGNYVPDLLQKIEQAHRQGLFRQKPIGPIGAHLRLLDARYAVAIEACIKALLFSFCCDNHADQRVLEKLFKDVAGRGQRMPAIIVCEFAHEMYDIRHNRVVCDNHPCLLDMLEIDNHVVANCLIDQRNVECVLLIENNAEARRLMGSNVPKNCREAFTARGDQIYPAPNFRYYSARNEKGGILQEDVETLITSLQEAINGLDQDYQAKVQKRSEFSQEKANIENDIKIQEQELIRMRQQLQRTKREIETLQNVDEPDILTINTIEEDLQGIEQQLVTLNEDATRARATFDTLKKEAEVLEGECREINDQLTVTISDTYDPLKDSLQANNAIIQELTLGEQQSSKKLSEQLAEEKKQQASCLSKSADVEEWRAKCVEDFGPFVTSTTSLPKLKEKFNIIQKQLALNEELRGNPVETYRMYLETSTKYNQIKDDLLDLKAFITKLKEVMVERERNYILRREFIAINISANFASTLDLKKFKGTITFNHENQTLDLAVETSKGCEEQKPTCLQGLSGGERSFTTVSFMLALWEAIRSPFRMMDEFDIFMDMVTRRISMDMILEFASNRANSQFIILTPLDMTRLNASDTLRIFKMSDPDRDQTVLPFESASTVQADSDDDDDS